MNLMSYRRTTELWYLIRLRRVERGISWLNQHAPPCWHRNFFDPLPGGRTRFRARIPYDNECPLALAFESRPEFANRFGYVTEAGVVRHFGLSPRWLIRHGFCTDPDTLDAVLEMQWEFLLRADVPARRVAFRHPTVLDREFAALDFLGPPKGRLRRALWGLPWFGNAA